VTPSAQALLPWMERAARIALRGHGGAEPNPMVGCVVLDSHGAFVAEGHHRRCGGPHAEVEALRRAGDRARGGTAIVTLEPCNHHGRTGPCSQALRTAGIVRVAYGCPDPNPQAAGGGATLRAAGIEAFHLPCEAAERVTAPFLHRVRTGLPWVIAKWAESADGRIATRPGEPRWISSERSRAMVHRERARVDAVLTGMGTVLVDDPLLTVRGTRARRTPLRAVWDPRLSIPDDRALVRTAREAPVLVACTPEAFAAHGAHADRLRAAGVEVVPVDGLRGLLQALAARGAATVLVEAGAGLVRALAEDGLVNDAWVFTAPHAIGDAGPRSMAPFSAAELRALPCLWHGMRGPDRVALYRFPA
jgi:diaminohydroxyphosphoribosylaminopyrimidine deaminase / 5-amino-6-(5-phosphoribosylamino)uracil reductase